MCLAADVVLHILMPLLISCVGEANTVQRDAVNLRYFTGDGVVKNVAPDQPAVFEVQWLP